MPSNEELLGVISVLRNLLGNLHYDEVSSYLEKYGYCGECYSTSDNCLCNNSDSED
jgi:hypothetical protein